MIALGAKTRGVLLRRFYFYAFTSDLHIRSIHIDGGDMEVSGYRTGEVMITETQLNDTGLK